VFIESKEQKMDSHRYQHSSRRIVTVDLNTGGRIAFQACLRRLVLCRIHKIKGVDESRMSWL
jgi:hypothetical protein